MGYSLVYYSSKFHTQNIAIFELRKNTKEGMTACSKIQEQKFARERWHECETSESRNFYFDAVSNTISSGKSSTTAMEGSTERAILKNK